MADCRARTSRTPAPATGPCHGGGLFHGPSFEYTVLDLTSSETSGPDRIGPYRILRKLGAGGMADVYLGVHEELGHEAAVKVLPLHMASQKHLLRRFEREFATCSRIDHPNVVRVYDRGTLERGCYYAMEYLPFPTLAEVLERDAPLPIPRALGFARDMALAFAHYHPLGLVHRDLKPSNLIVAKNDRIVLVDFGLVKDQSLTQMTRTGAMIGTPQYMSPELVKGTGAGAPSDVFQLGLILFECLTGQRAFDGDSVMEVAAACIRDPHPAASSLRADLPPALERFIDDCLKKAEEERPDAPTVLRRIEALARGDGDGGVGDATASESHPARGGSIPAAGKGIPASGEGIPAGRGASFETSRPLSVSRRMPPTALSDSSRTGPLLPSKRRWLAGMLALSLALLWAAWAFRPRPPHQMRNLRIHRGLQCVDLSWKSQQPYPSVIEWTDVKGGTSTRWKGAVSNDGEHRVRVSRIRPGRNYHWWVLFPDGKRSLRQSLKLEALDLTPVAVKGAGDGPSRLRWQSNLELRGLLRFRFPGEPLQEGPPDETIGLEHETPLPRSEGRLCQLELVALSDMGEEQVRDIGAWLRDRASEAGRAMSFDGKAFVKSLSIDTRVLHADKVSKMNFDVGYVDEGKRKELQKGIERRLEASLTRVGAISQFRKIRPFLPFALEERILDEETWQRLYESLARYALCLQYLRNQKVAPPLSSYPDLGFFAPRGKGRFTDARIIDVHVRPAICLSTPHPIDKDLVTARDLSFFLPDPKELKRVELSLRMAGFSSAAYMEIRLNGKGPLIAYAPGGGAMKGRLYLGLRNQWLQAGRNVCRFSIHLPPGILGTKKLEFRKVRLRLES